MGYWVARAWPGTRIFVFIMGCLAALNRLEVHVQQHDDEDGAALGVSTQPSRTTPRLPGTSLRDCLRLQRKIEPEHGAGVENGATVLAEACSCWRCCSELWCLCKCCTCLSSQMGPSSRGDDASAWAWRTDRLTGLYVFAIFAIVMVERFLFPIMGRVLLEGFCPMLEVSMMVSLTCEYRRCPDLVCAP